MGCACNKGDITEHHRLLSFYPLASAIKAVDRFTVACLHSSMCVCIHMYAYVYMKLLPYGNICNCVRMCVRICASVYALLYWLA